MSQVDPKVLTVFVGSPVTAETESERAALVAALESNGIETAGAVAVCGEPDVELAMKRASETKPDVAALIVLSGKSAPLQMSIVRSTALPCVVWAVGREFAFPSSALAVGALKEQGRRIALFHGTAEDEDTMAGFLAAVRAGAAITRLSRAKIGVVGGLFPNLVSCRYDRAVIKERTGAELVDISYERLQQGLVVARKDSDALDRLQAICAGYHLKTARESLLPGLALHAALKSIAEELQLEAFATECWSGLPEAIGLNPCLGFIDNSYVLACEGDAMLALLLLMVRYLTGKSVCVGDVRCLDSDNVLTMTHCGGPAEAAERGDVVLDLSPAAQAAGFTTVTCRPNLSPGPVTLVRFYGERCDQMHVASGDLLSCERSDDLTVSVQLRGRRSDFIDACLGNHYTIVPGDLRKELAYLGEWLKLEMVYT